jgi:hypothetical protein
LDAAKWFVHADRLAGSGPGRPLVVNLRRGVSAAYYGLFHEVTRRAAEQVLPGAPVEQQAAIRRSYGHGTMKTVGRWVAGQTTVKNRQIDAVVVSAASKPELVRVAETVVDLQQRRHEADYDHQATFSKADVLVAVGQARDACARLEAVEALPAYDAFMALLTLSVRDLR